MALTECLDCKQEISTEALVCPRCGRPTANVRRARVKRMRNAVTLWAVLIAFFLLLNHWMGGK